ncbi:MAG: TldD/PmbA family protein [Candidatus Heimdallarchaeota archaeon]|nr:TldD/PmbA family protein [Candidatus Heimdallarchaeota archaeon]
MTNVLPLEDALTYGIKFAKKNGVDQIEGYSNNFKEISIGSEKGIPEIVTGISTGVSYRVVSNNNLGFAFTKTLTKERIESTIKIAIQNAKSKGPDPDFKTLPIPSKKSITKMDFDQNIESLTSDNMADGLSSIIQTINDVKGMNYLQGQIFLNTQKEHLINSNGIDIISQSGGIGGFAAAITTKGLIPNYSFGIKGEPELKNFKYDDIASETISQTKRAASPHTINFNKQVPIILEPEASFGLLGGLLSLLITQLLGNNVARGSTPYSDQVGNLIATEDFSVIDNGINPNKITRSTYDSEGVPKEKTLLINKGVLQTYLLDTYYGKKLGLESNGKSSRIAVFGFGGDPIKSYPSISSTSIEVLPGNATKDEMIKETQEGFMLRSLMGLHMSDTSSGRFSVTGFGWYIKNGEIKYPVQGISISGMLPELLKNIDMISKERESMLLADCPYIRFANVPVTSKKFDLKTRFGLAILKIISTVTGKHPMV